jgi:hypothetical protein
LAKVGIIALLYKGDGWSIDELEAELRVAIERTALTKTWKINKVTVLDSGETRDLSDVFSNRFSDFRGR